jgi:repressor LexA
MYKPTPLAGIKSALKPVRAALTSRQQDVLRFIRDCVAADGLPPTRAEIARALGFSSPNAAEQHVKALVNKGALEWVPGTSRGLRIVSEDNDVETGLPLIGRVAAGSPILAQEHVLGHHPVDPSLFKPRAHYLLQVRGMSMRDAGMLDGDWVAVHKTRDATDGQIVVARVGDDVTVKTYSHRRNAVHLLPANPDFEPIVVSGDGTEFAIEGRVVGVIRRL